MNSGSSSRTGVQPNLRARIREATTNEILVAANTLFSERGVDRTSMADIAARAGMAVGTLYNHFRDREALLHTLLDSHQGKLLSELDAELESCADQPFAGQLRSVLARFFTSFERHRPLVESLLQNGEECKTAARRPKVLREIYFRFEELVRRGLAHGALDASLAPLLPALLMGVARTVMMAPMLTDAPKMSPSDVEPLAAFFMTGAGAQK
jgi:AcrR family transcriptional regulator